MQRTVSAQSVSRAPTGSGAVGRVVIALLAMTFRAPRDRHVIALVAIISIVIASTLCEAIAERPMPCATTSPRPRLLWPRDDKSSRSFFLEHPDLLQCVCNLPACRFVRFVRGRTHDR